MNRTHLPYTLEQLVILRAVAKGGSFKNAAQSLFLTQPAVVYKYKIWKNN